MLIRAASYISGSLPRTAESGPFDCPVETALDIVVYENRTLPLEPTLLFWVPRESQIPAQMSFRAGRMENKLSPQI